MSEKSKETLKTLVRDILIACAIAAVISIFFRPTLVKETSMEPTIMPNDYLIMSKQAYTFGEINRGDVVVFKSEIPLDATHNKRLIKRVIGLSGDIITISEGNVYINGSKVKESYIADGGTSGEIYNLRVPKGKVFVMGDHRMVSVDSRSSEVGCVDKDLIIGEAVFRLFPFNRMGSV